MWRARMGEPNADQNGTYCVLERAGSAEIPYVKGDRDQLFGRRREETAAIEKARRSDKTRTKRRYAWAQESDSKEIQKSSGIRAV
jgi:hypothetical protein